MEAVPQLLARKRSEAVCVPPAPGRVIVAQSRPVNGIVYTTERVNCGSPLCSVCRRGTYHGPYYYAYMRRGGAVRCFYVGKPGRKRQEDV